MISRTQSGNAAAIAIFLLFGLVGRVLADDQGCDLSQKSAYGASIGETRAGMDTGVGHMGWIRD